VHCRSDPRISEDIRKFYPSFREDAERSVVVTILNGSCPYHPLVPGTEGAGVFGKKKCFNLIPQYGQGERSAHPHQMDEFKGEIDHLVPPGEIPLGQKSSNLHRITPGMVQDALLNSVPFFRFPGNDEYRHRHITAPGMGQREDPGKAGSSN
jgi:hypothetical protein